jgi:hypothetical protein
MARKTNEYFSAYKPVCEWIEVALVFHRTDILLIFMAYSKFEAFTKRLKRKVLAKLISAFPYPRHVLMPKKSQAYLIELKIFFPHKKFSSPIR